MLKWLKYNTSLHPIEKLNISEGNSRNLEDGSVCFPEAM